MTNPNTEVAGSSSAPIFFFKVRLSTASAYMLLLYTNRGVLHFYIASRISIRALEGFFMTPVVVWHSGSLKLLLLQEARAHSSQSAVMLIANRNISRRQVGLPAPCALPGLVDEGGGDLTC